MSTEVEVLFNKLNSKNNKERYGAFQELMKMSEEAVEWFEEYKPALLEKLTDENSYQRSIGIMLLCNLAKNDKSRKKYIKIIEEAMQAPDTSS